MRNPSNVIPTRIGSLRINISPGPHWRFLPSCVRPHYVKRVRILGAEGSGKTTLANRLGAHYDTCVVPEFARSLATASGGNLSKRDFLELCESQLAAEEALARQAQRVLFCDTDPGTAALWSDRLHQSSPPWVRDRAACYDLTLLLDPVCTGLGIAESEARRDFHKRLQTLGPSTRVQGEEGLPTAIKAIDGLLEE